MIKSARKRDDVGCDIQFVLLVPAATRQFVRLNTGKDRPIQDGQLSGKILGSDPKNIENGTAVVAMARTIRQTLSFGMNRYGFE